MLRLNPLKLRSFKNLERSSTFHYKEVHDFFRIKPPKSPSESGSFGELQNFWKSANYLERRMSIHNTRALKKRQKKDEKKI